MSVECDKHGLLGIACEECLSQRRRDTIEEAARWLRTWLSGMHMSPRHADEMRAALLGKQAGEAPACMKCGDAVADHGPLDDHEVAPAPSEGAGILCGLKEWDAGGDQTTCLNINPCNKHGKACAICNGAGWLYEVPGGPRCTSCRGAGRTSGRSR